MLFVTNRALKEGKKTRVNRKVRFDLRDNEACQSLFFCRRDGKDDYTEIGSKNFLEALKASPAQQILFYIHGFNNLPETDIFPRAEELQRLFHIRDQDMVQVVPLIWPCDDDLGILKDYWDDQKAADASAFAFARALEKFLAWQEKSRDDEIPKCLKRINVLAHSMGNRVFRATLDCWARYDRCGRVPLLFRNSFLIAADIVNESLERGKTGDYICEGSRNVSVYYASDDLALRSSKAANVKSMVVSRRLGHSGPENPDLLPPNVYMIDCDDVNTRYDYPKGHSYFLADEHGKPGLVFDHIFNSVKTGRVMADPVRRTYIIGGGL